MEDNTIPYRIKKIKEIIESNKKQIISVFDKYFIQFMYKLMKKILKKIYEDDNYFKYTLVLTEIMEDISIELKNKYLCEKKKFVLEKLKKNLKKLFIAISIKYSCE